MKNVKTPLPAKEPFITNIEFLFTIAILFIVLMITTIVVIGKIYGSQYDSERLIKLEESCQQLHEKVDTLLHLERLTSADKS